MIEKAELSMAVGVHLTFTGVSRDGAHLLLLDDQGVEQMLEITPRLRAALRGDAPRTGQLEIKMDSTLRPRDIQARIRAGETAESVAEAARTTVEKIQPFVVPVLAERQHVADRAQRANVRRPAGESPAGSRSLGDAVQAHLRSCNIDPSATEWDAWRREDGRWTVSGDFTATVRSGTARFTFDMPGNYVTLENEDARWLVGESVATPAPARDDLQSARERRLTPVSEDELPLGVDAIDLVTDVPLGDLSPAEAAPEGVSEPAPDDAPAVPEPAVSHDRVDEAEQADPTAQADPTDEDVPVETPSRRPVQKKKGRASVPSWDEIMFGGGDQ